MKTWSAEQLGAFPKATADDRLHPLWHVLAMTGMRRGEALGLRWDDVDLEAGRLSVRRALIPSGREVVVSEPKTARGRRSIALDPETVSVLKAQAAGQLEQQAAWQEGWTDSGYFFTAEDGQYLNPEAVTCWFRQAVKKSMLPKIRLHDLRHTHATLALQAGVHPKVVSERLGHATVSITLDTYSHAIPALQEEAAVLTKGWSSTLRSWPERVSGSEARSRPDSQPHHPPPLRYLPVSLEAELLEQVGRARMEIGTALRDAPLDLLGVGLDEPASSIVDGGQRGAEGRTDNPTAPVPASSEDATDPPVGQLAQVLGIGFRVVDVRKLRRRPVLAPADAFIAVIDENLVHRSVANVGLLCQTVPGDGMALADALWVETHAPAAAPDAVVSLHQTGKVVPGVGTERPRHIGANRFHASTMPSSNSALATGPVSRAQVRSWLASECALCA